MITKYKAEIQLLGVPAYSIVNDISYPDKLTTDQGEDFMTPFVLWHSFVNKKLHDETSHLTGKRYDKKMERIRHKDPHKQYTVLQEDYQLPFSETGYRSAIFDKKDTSTITKENIKKWLIEEAYYQLKLEPSQGNPYAFAGMPDPVMFIKEVPFVPKRDNV